MASFFTDLVKPYVEKVINGAITESSYICCFTCIAKDFEAEKAKLEVERTTFNQLVDTATRGGEDVQANALFWEEQAVDLIQEDTKTKQKCFFGFCCNCIWRYRRGKELANKKEQIKKLIETRKELAIGLPAHLPDVERYSSQHYIPFKSRESKCKELLDALNDDNNYIVGLQGMGGTGKTTLAMEVGKKLKQSKQFTQVIDTTVSFSPDIKKIQDDIAGPLGLKFDDCNESDRPKKLWSRLTHGEKILLILDDVWGDIDFDEIGIPQSDNRKGCSVLVTTRNQLVCNRLGCSSTIQLDLLSEDDAWIMFQRHAGLSEVSTKNLLDRGRKIAKECKRLPIAIATIASSLKGKQRREEWDMALRSLQKHIPMHNVDGELDEVYKSLKFSYDNIRNEKTKRLFLVCSVFREDEEIPIEMLTRLGIGAGLLGEDFFNYEDSRSQVVNSKKELIDSSLLMEADCNIVKMHHLVRDAAQWLAKKEIQTIKVYNKYQKATVEREKNIKYLLCEGKLKDVFSCMPDGSTLEILIVTVDKDEDYDNVKIEVPNSFFENNVGLRVFHLFYDQYPDQLSLALPQSIQLLKNIRSLLFTLVDLGDISILGNLQSLETLDLKDCKIDELPHGMAKLEKFRLLNLEGCQIERNDPFEVIKECSSLEELYFTGSFNAFCREITFPELQRFCIDEYSRLVNDSSSKYVSVLDKDGIFLSETTLKYCIQTAEVLRLRRIEKGWRNLIPEIVSMDQGMNDIVELSLNCIPQLQYLIDTKDTDFQVPIVLPKLVVLELDRMENLEELFNGPISLDSLKNLEKLSIKDCKHLRSLSKCKLNLCKLKTIKLQNCPMLVSLFESLTSRSLVLRGKLQTANCEGLENIISDERREEESREEIDNIDNMSRGSMFPKLKVIDIEECPRLQYILPFLPTQGLLVLEAIRIRRCDELKYIFGQYHSMFTYRLHIWQRVQCLPIQSYSMCNIKEINLSHFLKMKSVFILSTTPRMLLETLTVTNCDELKNIIIDTVDQDSGGSNWGDVFPKLKRINVGDCIQLEYIFGHYTHHGHQNQNEVHLHLPALKHINLCNLPSLVAMSTKQYRTTFPPTAELEYNGCSQVSIKSFPGFVIHPISKSQGIEISVEEGSTSTNAHTRTSSTHFEFLSSSSGQLIAPEINNEGSNIKEQIPKDDDVRVSKSNKQHLNMSYLLHMKNGIVSNNYDIVETEMNATAEGKQEFAVNIPGLVIKMKQRGNSEIIVETKMKQTAEANQEFVVNVSGLEILEVANSQKLLNEQSTSQLGEIDTAVKPSQLEGATSEKTAATSTMSTFSETKNDADIQLYAPKQKGTKTITSSTHSKSVSSSSGPLATSETSSLEYGDGQIAIASPPIVITKPLTTQDVDVKNSQETSKTNDDQVSLNKKVKLRIPESKPFPIIPSPLSFQTSSMLPKGDPSQIDEKLEDGDDKIAIPSFSIAAADNNDQVSRNDDALKKESSNVEEQFPKDDDIIVSKSPVASQFPTVPYIGDPSQKVEDLSSSLLVKTELEQLVSKKHLDYENLSLLTDFLVKHPSVRLKDTLLFDRYKGSAYNLLAELLKFLETHSVLDVLGSYNSQFVELLQDARNFGFDMHWLDGVERRTLLPNLQV